MITGSGERDRRRVGAALRRRGRARGRDRPRRRAGRGRADDRRRRLRRGPGPRGLRPQARGQFGRIDVLMNNAGINPTDDGSVLDTSLEAWQRVQDVNLRSVFLCCKHGIPHLLDSGRRLGDQRRLLRRDDGRGRLADLLHGLEGRGARALARARRRVRRARRPRQRALPGPGQHAAARRSSSPRTPSAPPSASSTCRWAASASPRRSPRRPSSWPATTRASSPPSTFLVDGGLSGAYLTPGQVD